MANICRRCLGPFECSVSNGFWRMDVLWLPQSSPRHGGPTWSRDTRSAIERETLRCGVWAPT
eukprot:6526652-Lingulodinium_polyedra.AAC.1